MHPPLAKPIPTGKSWNQLQNKRETFIQEDFRITLFKHTSLNGDTQISLMIKIIFFY